jgi:SAM-dependent methyltransferase
MSLRHAPATLRNRDPILAVLRRALPSAGTVLEIGSGSGEHAAYFASALAPLRWQPTDASDMDFASISGWAREHGASTVEPPLVLDSTADTWPVTRADAIFSANVIHIAPWAVAEGMLRGARRVLPSAAPLVLYGPFMRDGAHTAPSNAAFDAELRRRDPSWGIRDLGAVTRAADAHGLDLDDVTEMPANNLTVVFRRR